MDENTRNAEAFLETILKGGKGRLKIYLGWAPGVGKTHRALLDLRGIKERGVDAVLGWIEDKSRPGTPALIRDLERIPPLRVQRHGLSLEEMDVDAILRRKPATVFIDELAHANPPGFRNARRIQDVSEILDAGISVITTLNALHISELSPTIAGILGVPVSETVPSEILRSADEVVLVDLSPSTLQRRIREGAVLPLPQAAHALRTTYRESNLVKLREITLNFMARQLDRVLIEHGEGRGVGERIVVVTSDRPDSIRQLVGYGAQLSRRLGGELFVLHLRKTPLFGRLPPMDPEAKALMTTLTEQSGGTLSILYSRRIGFTLWRQIQRLKATQVILGHFNPEYPWRRSLVRSFLRHFSIIDVEVRLIATGERKPTAAPSPLSEIPRPTAHFKIYLGSSAGIGKTYAMLKEAQELKTAGTDVVIGYLESHRRPETIALAEGLEVVPRKIIQHRGILLEEMDVDAILKRKPALALVDELAHTNPPGSLREKRYEDVVELLNAGIDVTSTLNVQHLESLNDLISFKTGIRVLETVPDRVVLGASEIVLVDLSPEALRERLMEGKIYPMANVPAALENFFTTENLTALRELAMKRIAESTESRFSRATRGGIVLVAVSDRPEDAVLIRRGGRLSERLWMQLKVLMIRPRGKPVDAQQISQHERLTHALGGDFRAEEGNDWVDILIRRALEINPDQLILGQSAWKPGFESTAERIAKKLTKMNILIVPLDIRRRGVLMTLLTHRP